MYLNSFNLFRAISIIFIVASHTFNLAGIKHDHFLEKVLANLLSGGTALFVFISGFLFHHIFYNKYDYIKFMKGKFKNVLIPYVLLGILPIMILVIQMKPDWGGVFLPNSDGVYDKYVIPTLKYYATGRFLISYWYIPFIITMFALSPLHVLFIKTNIKYQFLIVVVFSTIAIFLHRPLNQLGLLQSLMYFMPYYLFGILASINKLKIYSFCDGREMYILLVVLLLSLTQSLLGIISYSKEPFEYGGIDLMFFQKIAMSFFFMVFLKKYESFDNKFINTLAATSFTVYFIHSFFLYGISKVNTIYNIYPEDSWFIYIFLVFIIIVSCVFIAKFTKRMIPDYSRYITGF